MALSDSLINDLSFVNSPCYFSGVKDRRGRLARSAGLYLLGFVINSLVLNMLVLPDSAFAQTVTAGDQLFAQTCAHCHGAGGTGGELGPAIFQAISSKDDAELIATLRSGVPAKGMPPVTLDAANMQSLVGFLRTGIIDVQTSPDTTAAPMPKQQHRLLSEFTPVTEAVLMNPAAQDWLWFSRTPDAQRYSPLKQIDRSNVAGLSLAWTQGLPEGLTETIPTVYQGIMYLTLPGGDVAALDATNGDLLWQYSRQYRNSAGGSSRSKTLAIFADMVYFGAPDSTVIALDARTGEVRWEAETPGRGNTSGAIVAAGKVFTGGTCSSGGRKACYISAHDAYSGELVWKFFTAQGPDDPPGYDTWVNTPLEERLASTWGLPGSYDVETDTLFWSVSNPMPNTRSDRHGGDAYAIPLQAPADLYSNSTLALNPHTGELRWYYQHLPGDDWDEDINEERIIMKTRVAPDPAHVRWINPDIAPDELRDVVVNVGEGGGLWALDKRTGQFLWATPFPENTEDFIISDIDVHTGIATINAELLLDKPGITKTVCYFNTRSYWPSSYNSETNSLYVPYIQNCLKMTSASKSSPETRVGVVRDGVPLAELNGLAKVNMSTGEITRWPTGMVPTNSAILTTAGSLLFWGDINRRFRALDAESGEVLWETVLGGPISVSNITYAVDGRQYVAVITGNNLSHPGLNTGTMGPLRLDLHNGFHKNAIYVFALPMH